MRQKFSRIFALVCVFALMLSLAVLAWAEGQSVVTPNSYTMVVGEETNWDAVFTYNGDAPLSGVRLVSSDNSVLSVKENTFKAEKEGKATLYTTLFVNGVPGDNAECEITIVKPSEEKITVEPGKIDMTVGQHKACENMFTFSKDEQKLEDVALQLVKSSNSEVVSVFSTDKHWLTVESVGEAEITVNLVKGGQSVGTATCKVVVEEAPERTLTVEPAELEMEIGEEYAWPDDFTFKLDGKEIKIGSTFAVTSDAEVVAVDYTNFTIIAKTEGTADITITVVQLLEDGSTETLGDVTCKVTVKAEEEKKALIATPDTYTLIVGENVFCDNIFTFEVDGEKITPYGWKLSTSDEDVMGVDEKYHTIEGRKSGTATLTMELFDEDGASLGTVECKVTVVEPLEEKVTVEPETIELTVGDEKGCEEVFTFYKGDEKIENAEVRLLASSDVKIVGVNASRFKAISVGEATLTMNVIADGESVGTATCKVIVKEKTTTGGSTGSSGSAGTSAPTIPTTPTQPEQPDDTNTYKPSTPATAENLAKDNWTSTGTAFKHTEADGTPSTGVRVLETSDGAVVRYVFNNDGTVVANENTVSANSGITVTTEGEVLVNGNLYYLNPDRDLNDPRTCYVMMDYLRIRDNYAGQTYYDKDGITFTGWMKNAEGGLRYQTRIPQSDKATDLYLIVWRVQDLPACQHPDHPGDPAYYLPAGRYFFDDEGVLVQKEGWNDGKDGKEYYTNANGMVTQERAK